MIIYLTFNDSPSGIYSSQVIDVVKFMRIELKANVSLLAFISLRKYFENSKKIKNELPGATVLPMFPGIQNWRKNSITLKTICLFKKPSMIIGRSVIATNLALSTATKKIVYDGRGAIAAEWKEYKVVNDQCMLMEISGLEKKAIQNSDYRLAVSSQLVKHWREQFDYSGGAHAVIPCTINKSFENIGISAENILSSRKRSGIDESDIVFAYSGSLAGWQSFELLYTFIQPILNTSPRCKLLFLSDRDEHITKLEKEFPGKIICKKVSPDQVPSYLIAADYGLLVREKSVTNQVASPVKFAEYLACGLKVIISEELGDYSEFVKKNNCGHIFSEFKNASLVLLNEKKFCRSLALEHFTKIKHLETYKKILAS